MPKWKIILSNKLPKLNRHDVIVIVLILIVGALTLFKSCCCKTPWFEYKDKAIDWSAE